MNAPILNKVLIEGDEIQIWFKFGSSSYVKAGMNRAELEEVLLTHSTFKSGREVVGQGDWVSLVAGVLLERDWAEGAIRGRDMGPSATALASRIRTVLLASVLVQKNMRVVLAHEDAQEVVDRCLLVEPIMER